MPILKVTPDWQTMARSESIDLVTLQGSGAASATWDVEFTDGPESAQQRLDMALVAAGVPVEWETWPGAPWVFVDGKSSRFKGGPTVVAVDVTYISIPDPLAQPAIVEWGFATEAGEFEVDKDGILVANSSDEPFDPPIQRNYTDLLLRVTRNEPFYDPVFAATYMDSVNNDVFRGFDPGQVKCKLFTGQPARAAGLEYHVVVREFQMRTADSDPLNVGWLRRLADKGYRTKDSEGVVTVITDDAGKALSEPSDLDGNGAQLASGETPVFREFRDYDELPFTILGVG